MEKEIYKLLLEECTQVQQEFFKKLYPNGLKKDQLNHALFQVKNSAGKNKIENKHVKQIQQLTEQVNKDIVEKAELKTQIIDLITENRELKIKIAESVFEFIEPKRRDSLFLEALESAGVDNWDGYELAIDIYNDRLLSQPPATEEV